MTRLSEVLFAVYRLLTLIRQQDCGHFHIVLLCDLENVFVLHPKRDTLGQWHHVTPMLVTHSGES